MTLLGQGLINNLFGQIPQLLSNFLVWPYHVNFSKAQASYQLFQKNRDFIVAKKTKNIGIYRAFW